MIHSPFLRALCLALALASPVGADNGACTVPIETTQGWAGRMLLVNVVVELQSPGAIYVCPERPDHMAAVRFTMRRQLSERLGLPDPVLDSCVSYLDLGAHPTDGFARVQLRDTAGSYACIIGPDADGIWSMVPARRQTYHLTWYLTP